MGEVSQYSELTCDETRKNWCRLKKAERCLCELSHLPPACPGHRLPCTWHDVNRKMKTSYWHPACASPNSSPSCLSPSASHFLSLSLALLHAHLFIAHSTVISCLPLFVLCLYVVLLMASSFFSIHFSSVNLLTSLPWLFVWFLAGPTVKVSSLSQ